MTSEEIQELERRLERTAGGLEEIDNLNQLASELITQDSDRSDRLAQRALLLSRGINPVGQSYPKGIALSLSILGSIASHRSDYQMALSQLLEAKALLEVSQDRKTLSIVLRDLGWVYFNLGDFPLAIQFLHKALKYSRENGDTDYEAKILNTLGAVYGESGNKKESIDVLRKALKFLDRAEDLRLRCLVFNNLAMTQFEIKAYDDALKSADQSLAIARRLNSSDLLATTMDTTGQIYLAKKEYAKAESFFNQAQSHFQGEGNDPDEIKLNLAQAAIGQGRIDDATHWLQQALESAEARGVNRFIYKIHELLSKIYEGQGDLKNAIEHFKRMREIKSQVYNEETQLRLGNMVVLQQAETTRIEEEIYRLKNQALKKEISDSRQAVAEMENLATTDALTGLLNRRHFLTLGTYAFEVAQKSGQPLGALMMDIDDFKKVNDSFGHLAGDQMLKEVSAAIQAGLRKGDLLGRYGGDEFAAILPNTDLPSVRKVAERIIKKSARQVSRAGFQSIKITLSVGIAQAKTTDESLEALLDWADQALYAAKNAGKNRTMTARAEIIF